MALAKRRKIGILTGGGDCPGLNAVIRAVVKDAVMFHDWEVIGITEGFDGLLQKEAQVVPLGLAQVQGLLVKGGTILGTTSRGNPFKYPVKIAGETEYRDVSQQVVDRIDELGLDSLIIIGGDGTINIAKAIHEKGVPLVTVPKTIDNDVPITDVSFGFDSAVHCAVEALDRLHSTAESHNRAMILEVMGRSAGWIALYVGLAGGADLIAIPEIPYSIEKLAAGVEMRRGRGSRFITVVVAEGAHPIGGSASTIPSDPGQLPRLVGAGYTFANQLATVSDIESRVTVLGHIQRGGTPSPFDRILATRLGVAAVENIAKNLSGHMICIRNDKITTVPLDEVTGQKLVNPHDQIVTTAKATGILFGD